MDPAWCDDLPDVSDPDRVLPISVPRAGPHVIARGRPRASSARSTGSLRGDPIFRDILLGALAWSMADPGLSHPSWEETRRFDQVLEADRIAWTSSEPLLARITGRSVPGLEPSWQARAHSMGCQFPWRPPSCD